MYRKACADIALQKASKKAAHVNQVNKQPKKAAKNNE